ncbi:lactococcin family bacteriocin [Lactococcus petauri]
MENQTNFEVVSDEELLF